MIAPHTVLGAALIGLFVGFLGGLLGKGGSAIATPLLHAIGVPAIVAVAAPLPATIPSTLAASWVYWRAQHIERRVVRTCVAWGVPATVAGAIATRWIGGGVLVRLTDALLVVLGVRLLVHRREPGHVAEAGAPARLDDRPSAAAQAHGVPAIATPKAQATTTATWATATATATSATTATSAPPATATTTVTSATTATSAPPAPSPTAGATAPRRPADGAATLAIVAILVGLSAGLLANSGGFLLAPLLITVVRMPIRPALASSLAVSAVLAVPGTIVHAALGHIDWTLVAVLAVTSVPLSIAGARIALRVDAARLERVYGAMLLLLGGIFLLTG